MDWKTLLREAQEAAKAALAIKAKAAADGGRALTDDENEEYSKKYALATSKKEASDAAKKAADSAAFLKSIEDSDDDIDDDDDDDGGDLVPAGGGKRGAGTKLKARSFGQRFIKSAEYEAFQKANPSGVGEGSPVDIGKVKVGSLDDWHSGRKALTSPQARIQNIRVPMVDMVDRDRLTFLDLISRGQTAGNFEYVQVIAVTRNAAVVPEATSGTDAAALKPVSELSTQLADAKVYTYADGYDVTNQLLADAPAFATYMDAELRYSLDAVVEDKLLNGTGINGQPKGIYNTTGVQSVEYAAQTVGVDGLPTDATVKAFIRASRIGILKVIRVAGGNVDAIVLSPEMDAALDLLQDNDGRYYSGGPFGGGANTLFGRPRVTSEKLADTHAVLGDFKQVALLDREGLSVVAFNQHKDYAQRNMTYVRGELRAAQVIWKPARLVIIKPAAA